MKTLDCRTHGGKFTVESKRGRPPVKCTPENQCSAVPVRTAAERVRATTVNSSNTYSAAEKSASRAALAATAEDWELNRMSVRQLREFARNAGYSTITKLTSKAELLPAIRKQQVKAAAPVQRAAAAEDLTERIEVAKARAKMPAKATDSVIRAQQAKQRLEPLGWQLSGRAWIEDNASLAEVTGTRDDETIILTWTNGVLTDQHYSVWDVDQPAANNKPASKLPFDTDEMPDRELVQRLSGMKVTWWNALGQSEETAIIPGNKVVIEHAYSGIGDETPADRIIKFVDVSGSGFRAFRVGALLKIGK